MYSPLVVAIAINVGRWVPRLKTGGGGVGVPTWPILAGLALAASFLLYKHKWSMRSSVVLPTLILIVAAFAVVDRFQRCRKLSVPLMLLSLAVLVAARICWVLDVAGKFSGPDTWLQGHAVWHLLTALSLASIYLYYRLEAHENVPS
jgi:predicted membrane channel-forming protein YqfA (hemolysin III family)